MLGIFFQLGDICYNLQRLFCFSALGPVAGKFPQGVSQTVRWILQHLKVLVLLKEMLLRFSKSSRGSRVYWELPMLPVPFDRAPLVCGAQSPLSQLYENHSLLIFRVKLRLFFVLAAAWPCYSFTPLQLYPVTATKTFKQFTCIYSFWLHFPLLFLDMHLSSQNSKLNWAVFRLLTEECCHSDPVIMAHTGSQCKGKEFLV